MRNGQPFGPWLRQRRKALDLTQDELATCVGCSAAAIQMIEQGQRRPSRQIAALLATCLRVPDAERAPFVAFARASLPVPRASPPPAEGGARPAPPLPTNLPTSPTPLLGRAADLAAIGSLLLRDDVRLLTLSGPPGIGKTSLAIAAGWAVRARPEFQDGLVWVALAAVSTPDLVLPSLARLLGVPDGGPQPVLETLTQALKQRRLLLLLDNCEQVIEAATDLAELLAACPHLKLLATSRESLHLRAEYEFHVLPLPLPDLSDPAAATAEALATNPAVALFVERAQAVDQRFSLAGENARLVAAICARLEGLPLAIELVAARTRMLPLGALLARLQQTHGQSHLNLLAGGARDLPDRHKTLRDAIGWSYDLLSRDEQRLFGRLGVFLGGFTLAAAEAICNARADLSLDLFEGVAQLLQKNLLKREPLPTDGEAEAPENVLYFSMLVTIREYALERLAERGEVDELRRLHSEYYLAIAAALEPMLPVRKNERSLFNTLDREYDNLRAALTWTIAHGPVSAASQLGIALAPYWILRGRLGEGRDWLERIVAAQPAVQGADADARISRALLLYESGIMHSYLADYPRARSRLEESLPVLQAFGVEKALANTLMGLGGIARLQGDYATAESYYQQCLDVGRALGSKWAIRSAFWVLGITAGEQGDLERAAALLTQSLALARAADDVYVTYCALRELAMVRSYEGRYDAAIALFAEFFALGRQAGFRVGMSAALDGLAFAVMRHGDSARAESLYRESLTVARDADKQRIPDSLEGLAELELARADGEAEQASLHRAATLLGAAEGARRILATAIIPVRAPVRERLVAQAEARLGAAAYARDYAAGQALSLEDAICWGLGARSDTGC